MRRWVLAVIVGVICVSTLLAQISLDVSLVTLVATVSDRSGRSVPDLGPADFVVVEDGKEQNISLVEQNTDLPLSIGVLIDASYSMEPKIQTATAAIDQFLESLGPTDDIFLMSFSAKPKVEQNFTSDRKKISRALHKVKLGNRTALYDSIEQGLQKIRDGKHEKKALLLVTDGQDTTSRIRLDQVMTDIRQSHVLLYCLGIGANPDSWLNGPPYLRLPGGIVIPFPGPARNQFPSQGGRRYPGVGPPPYAGPETADMRVLNMLAAASGAKAWQVTPGSANSSSIDEVLDEVAAELRSQYTIGYYPSHGVNDGKWHQVVVRTKNPNYEVRSRKEYYGGQPGR
ncbi:MAG TPA: VWA domain-containing protein [Terriglobia bacterium]|nr:VWA domain-containing protein [Terriglobia bacterium]